MEKVMLLIRRGGPLLAINLLMLTVWGCAAMDKVRSGVPSWFSDKFGQTFLANFPGLTATFWLLAISEILAAVLAAIALFRFEFVKRKTPFLTTMLVWSLFVFVQLSLGQWLTFEFSGTAQLFAYFAGTLLCLHYVNSVNDS